MRILYFAVSSSVLIGLVLLVQKLMKRYLSPGVRYALWLIPMLQLLVPFGAAELPVFGTAAEFLSAPYTALSELSDASRTEEAHAIEVEQVETPPTAGTERTAEGKPVEIGRIRETERRAEETGERFFYLIWLLGSLLLGGYALCSNLRLRKAVLRMKPEEGEGPLELRVSENVDSPCLFGLFRPCILMSCRVREDRELYPYALRHELAHYAQHDHIWTFVRAFLCILYWWHPFVWLGASCSREDGELACDARVLRGCSAEEKKAYGLSLLRILTEAGRRQSLMCGATAMCGGKKNLRRRVEGIRDGIRTKKKVLIPVCLLLAAALLFACCMPSTKSYIRVTWDTELPPVGICYETSFQEELQSKLYYYEIYQYGELMERRLIAYGSLGEDRRSENKLSFDVQDTAEQENGVINLEFDWEGTKVSGKIELPGRAVQGIAGAALMKNGEGKKIEVQDGDDFALIALYPRGSQEDTSKAVDIGVAEKTEEEKKEILSDQYLAVFIRMAVSSLPEDELCALFEQKEYPAAGSAELGTADHAAGGEEPGTAGDPKTGEETASVDELVRNWAKAMADRDGMAICSMASDEVQEQFAEVLLLSEGEDGKSFGWSSPWILSGEDGYRIESMDEEEAELLYYVWDSTPHLYVWRERLTFAQEGGSLQVATEYLEYLEHISSAEEYERAYPGGRIAGTPMDYLTNGMGEALNRNAVEHREEQDVYAALFDAGTAACSLLNIPYNIGTDRQDGLGIRVSAEDTAGETVVHISFGMGESSVEVRMIQPYGEDGIWIPQ